MIGVLTVAPWHNSVGDIATADATSEFLSRSGLPNTQLWEASDDVDHLVIGGGDLLYGGDVQPWSSLLTRFQVPGPHVLNAAGIDHETMARIDWSFARDYLMVAVRDDYQAAHLPDWLPNVRSVPCPATLGRGMPWHELCALPGYESLESVPVGEYVLAHRHPAVEGHVAGIAEPVLVTDMQAWQRHPWRADGLQLPWTHSPLVTRTLVENARTVLTSSLHLAIFALAANTPFVVTDLGDKQSLKVRRYMERAGVAEAVMFSGGDPVAAAEAAGPAIAAGMVTERHRARAHLEELGQLLGGRALSAASARAYEAVPQRPQVSAARRSPAPGRVEEPDASADRSSLSVVVLTNGGASVTDLVRSATAGRPSRGTLQVVVVTDEDSAPPHDDMGEVGIEVEHAVVSGHTPPSGAWRAGLERVRGDLTLLVSDDVRLVPSWGTDIWPLFVDDRTCSIASPAIRTADGLVPSNSLDSSRGVCLVVRSSDLWEGRLGDVRYVPSAVAEAAG